MIKTPRFRQIALGLLFSFAVFIPPYGDRFISASPNLFALLISVQVLYSFMRTHPKAEAATPWRLALDTTAIPALMVGLAMVIAGLLEFDSRSWLLTISGFFFGFGLIVLLGQIAALFVELKRWINRRADA